MDNMNSFFSLFNNPQSIVAVDKSHALYVVGALLSKKPEKVLEVGIGTGFLSMGLLMGLRYNKKGTLTCVDNWMDWQGIEPPEMSSLRDAGVNIIAPIAEKDFVMNCPSNEYDFIISDGDHLNSGEWVDEYLRITKPDGFMFFHDTNQHDVFPSLALIEKRVKELDLPYFHFTQSSRTDEHCERGLLFVINRSSASSTAPFEWKQGMTKYAEFFINHHNHSHKISLLLDVDKMIQGFMFFRLANNLLYEKPLTLFFTKVLQSGDCFIDVGANVGYFSLVASVLTGKEGLILAFEPERHNFKRLQANIALNEFDNIIPYYMAVGDDDKSVSLFFNSDNDGGHALWDIGGYSFNKKSQETTIKQDIHLTKLDTIVNNISTPPIKAIKIDTEGYEHHVLIGAIETIRKHNIPFIAAELNRLGLKKSGSNEDLFRMYMNQLGYDTYLYECDENNNVVFHKLSQNEYFQYGNTELVSDFMFSTDEHLTQYGFKINKTY